MTDRSTEPGEAAVSPAAARRALADRVGALLAEILGLPAGQRLGPRDRFLEVGFDSLRAVDFKTRLEAELGCVLPTTLIFDHPTLGDLMDHLAAIQLAAEAPAAAADRPGAPAPDPGEPIAIVGLACRFPGGARDPDAFWEMQIQRREAVAPIPEARWPVSALFREGEQGPGLLRSRFAAMLEDVAGFDAAFFRLSPREAAHMDPQQRLLLEVCWEALERACIAPDRLEGVSGGVFIGIKAPEYLSVLADRRPEQAGPHRATGNELSAAAGRISYTLGLTGPSLAVDTACSASLVAVHLAVGALRRGECALALAGGVNLLLDPLGSVGLGAAGMMAEDGRCKAFDAAGDGYGRAEGCGIVVLKTLAQATADGDRILALIRGSAVNQDGASAGLTAPSGRAQQAVIRAALADAGLDPRQVSYVEAHGTGTPLGDPIELNALDAVYGGAQRDGGPPLIVGSIKTNLAHLETAAGVAGLIRVVQALEAERVPAALHQRQLNPNFDWEHRPIRVARTEIPWPRAREPRFAGVSSFGFAGTNAHVVLEEAPRPRGVQRRLRSSREATPELVLLSADHPGALDAQGRRLAAHLRGHPALELRDVAGSLAIGRATLRFRRALVARTGEALATALEAPAEPGPPAPSQPPRVIFLFPGQGHQAAGMGQDLDAREPVFREALDRCAAVLDPELGLPLRELLWGAAADRLQGMRFTQAALTALSVALVSLWRSFGVEPAGVLGHSVGEIAAAWTAGVLSLEHALLLAARRGQIIEEQTEAGGMLSVDLGEAALIPLLAEAGGGAALAAINGPETSAVAAPAAALDRVEALLLAAGARVRRLEVSRVAHSPWMRPALGPLRRVLEGITFSAPRCPITSSLDPARSGALHRVDYWLDQLVQPVRFAEALASVVQDGARCFLEIGPHPSLSVLGAGRYGDPDFAWIASQDHRVEGREALLRAAGQLFTRGVALDPAALFAHPRPPRRLPLPTYAFQRQHTWLAPPPSRAMDPQGLGQAEGGHPLLGALSHLPDGGALWTGALDRARQPWLADHALFDTVILPGAAILDLALHAAIALGCRGVRELVLEAPLSLAEPARVQLSVRPPDATGERALALHSQPAETDGAEPAPWIRHATATLVPGDPSAPTAPLARWPPADAGPPLDLRERYAAFAAAGLAYGPAFQGLRAVWPGPEGRLYAEASLPEALRGDGAAHPLHPALLDACLQALSLAIPEAHGRALVPFALSAAALHAVGATAARVALTVREADADRLTAEARLWDAAGAPLASLDGLSARRVTAAAVRRALAATRPSPRRDLYPLVAEPVALPEASEPHQIIFLKTNKLIDDLSGHLVLDLRPDARSGALDPDAPLRRCAALLAGLQALLARPDEARPARLSALTRGAQAGGPGDPASDLGGAACWGLLRAARAEHPELGIQLLDMDETPESEAALARALSRPTGEELLLRAGRLLRLQLRDLASLPERDAPGARAFNPAHTALITGGTGGLGRALARHLSRAHGAQHLCLLSRSGPAAPGAEALRAELIAAGARSVQIIAADVRDPTALAAVIDALPAEAPLGLVVHAAGLLRDGLLASQSLESFAEVFAPKLAGALALHAATRHQPALSHFLLFSSASGLLGNAGQANYAAANAALDALASHRQGLGLPATALAWGGWEEVGLAAGLRAADRARLARAGLPLMPVTTGLSLFDAALNRPEASLLAARVDRAALARLPEDRQPTLLRALIAASAAPLRPAANAAVTSPEGLAAAVAGRPAAEGRAMVLRLVRAQIAETLGLPGPDAVPTDHPLKELGIDSLMAVEIRNRLSAHSGLSLAATLVFDFPSAGEIAAALWAQLPAPGEAPAPPRAPGAAGSALSLEPIVAGLRALLARPEGVPTHLRGALQEIQGLAGASAPEASEQEIRDADLEALIAMGLGER